MRLKWKRYTVCTNWWDSNFFGVGLLLFPLGLLLSESMLYITVELVTVKVATHMAVYYLLKDLAAY